MKKIVSLLVVSAAMALSAKAATIFSDNFTYSDGNLVGNGGWIQTSNTSTNPVQVTSGAAVIGIGGGQDIYAALSSTVSTSAGSVLEADFTLTSITATATSGDYFFHFGSSLGSTGGFYGRVFAKTDASGSLYLGISTVATTSIVYGSALTGAVGHAISLTYSFNGGSGLDKMSLSVDEVGYLNYTAIEASPTQLVQVDLRQGGTSAGAYPSVTIDNLVVTATPEPATFAILGLGAAFLGFRRRRKLA